MTTQRPSSHSCEYCSGSSQVSCNLFWSELQSWLKPYVLSWIYADCLPIWHGQELEIADDVLQETSIRILRYLRPALAGDSRTIESLEHFSLTVARNCLRDMLRRERRLVRLTETTPGESSDAIAPAELALDHLITEDLFVELAQIIEKFPTMQRRAILTDLAKYTAFMEEASLLAAIFSRCGINLREYRRPRPLDVAERNKQASLLSIAYKRLRRSFSEAKRKSAA